MRSLEDRLRAADDGDTNALPWRDQVLGQILKVVFAIGAAVAAPSILLAIRDDIPVIAILDAVALTWVGIIAFRRDLPYALRAWSLVILAYLLGFVFLLTIGVASQIYLIAVGVLAALFVGARAGLVTLAVSTLTLFAAGYFGEADLPMPVLDHRPLAKWVVLALNFAFVSGVLLISTSILLGRLERSLGRQKSISASLEENAARLTTANDELASEVERRRLAQEQTTRLAHAIDQAGDGILIADGAGRIDYANDACSRFCDGAAGGLLGRRVGEVWGHGDPLAPIAAAVASGLPWAGSVTRGRPGGREREVDARLAPLRPDDRDGRHFVIVLRDVTRERQLEARLRQGEKLEAVGTLAGGVAHDFNNIIGSILAVAESIRAHGTAPTPEESVEQIILACIRAKDIVRQMMLLARNARPERRPLSVRDVIEEVTPLLRAALPANVVIESDVTTSGTVVADPSEIHQVLMNLASNAGQAMEATGGGVLSFALRSLVADEALAATRPGIEVGQAYVHLAVRDDGVGIEREHIDRIFEPFFTTKEAGTGTGLGLASVHGIVSSLGGTVDVYSEPGRGAVFHVYLPQAAAPVENAPPEPRHDRAAAAAGGRILLVDDEAPILRVCERFLARAGYEVTAASDGETARRLLEAAPADFDLLLTDLTMPGLSGAELIRRAHALRPGLPSILTSGFGDRMTDEERRSLAPVCFLAKPYSQEQLAELVRRSIAAAA